MRYVRGDVVWSADPFKPELDATRPWLVLNDETHPFSEEQYMAVALSTSGYDTAVPIRDDDWIEGGTPRRSYVLPWAVHSPQHRFVEFRQGRLAGSVIERVVDDLIEYIDSGDRVS